MAFSKSKTTQLTDQSTKTNIENKQTTATDGAIAAGAGANVNITDGGAIKGNIEISKKAFDTAEKFGELARDTTRDTFSFANQQTDKVSTFSRDALDTVRSTTEQANALLARSQEAALEKVQRAQGVDQSTIQSEGQRNNLYLTAAIVAIGGLAFFFKGGR